MQPFDIETAAAILKYPIGVSAREVIEGGTAWLVVEVSRLRDGKAVPIARVAQVHKALVPDRKARKLLRAMLVKLAQGLVEEWVAEVLQIPKPDRKGSWHDATSTLTGEN